MARHISSVLIDAPLEMVFDFHTDPKNLERIMPGNVKVLSCTMEGLFQGAKLDLVMRWHGLITKRWLIELEVFKRPNALVDLQIKGPFKAFRHVRTFEAAGGMTLLTDDLSYELPFRFFGRLIEKLVLGRTVKSQFAYRHVRTKELLELQRINKEASTRENA